MTEYIINTLVFLLALRTKCVAEGATIAASKAS